MTPTMLDRVPNAWLAALLAVVAIMGFITVSALFLIWLERKVSARMQRRLGPTEVGPHGTLQTLNDVGKLLGKQLITPRSVDRPLYHLAPAVVFVPAILGLSLFPIDRGWALTNFNIGLVLVFTFAGIGILGIFMAGWGSNNKYALLGAMRSVSQNIAYEIPLILSALAVVLVAGSMNLKEIADAQTRVWFVLLQPVAALIYFTSAVAETNRAPFDIPEAESELVAGFHTEYSGMRFAMFFLAEYTNMVIVSMVATTLFLGGYHGPLLPGWIWFFLKVYFLIFVMMWFRWTFPRLRFDQLMNFSWGGLVPLAILNLLVTAVVVKVIA
jgi:NADH-quinone oxidoreductase subunit H